MRAVLIGASCLTLFLAATGGAATGAARALAPTVTTSDATEIGPFKARLNGTVNPNGLATNWYFEFGKTTAYGAKTPVHSAGSGTAPRAESSLQEGLEAGVTYHFRIVASSAAGTVVSPDRTFVTDSAPSVKTGPAGSVGATSATVTGTINPHGRGSTYWFDYGTTSRYTSRTPVQDAGFGTTDKAVAFSIEGLTPGRTYHYRIVGRSDAGTVNGADARFATTDAPTVTPKDATQVGADRATFNALVNPQGRSTTWYFEYGTTTAYGTQTSSSAIGNGTRTMAVSFQVVGLAPATTYHYRVVAVSRGGTTRGDDRSFATLGPPLVHTGAVTRLSTSAAVVSGTVDPRGQATTYWVEYGHTSSYGLRTGTGSLQPGSGQASVSFPLSGLAPGVRYHYRVVARSAAGTGLGDDRSFGTSPLPRDARGRRVACTIVGTVSPDVLRGTPGPDVICGLGGSDVIVGLGGNDVIYGGPGNDRLEGGFGRDTIVGGAGRDLLLGGPGRDLLISRDRTADVVNGGPGRDRARVDRGRDRLVSVAQLLR
jgi:hypothetical protein